MTDMVEQAYLCGKNSNPGDGFPLPAKALPEATAVSPGAMSAADKAKADTQAPGGWFDKQVDRAALFAPGAVTPRLFQWIRPQDLQTGITDGVGEAGVVAVASSLAYLSTSITATGKAAPWFVAFQAKFPSPVLNKVAQVGVDGGGANRISLSSQYNAATTQMYLQHGGAGGSSSPILIGVVNPALWLDFIIAWDGVNLKAYLGDTLVASVVPAAGYQPEGNLLLFCDCTAGYGPLLLRNACYVV